MCAWYFANSKDMAMLYRKPFTPYTSTAAFVLVLALLSYDVKAADVGYGYISTQCGSHTKQSRDRVCGKVDVELQDIHDILREILPIASTSIQASTIGKTVSTEKGETSIRDISHAVVVSAPLEDLEAWNLSLQEDQMDAEAVVCEHLPSSSSLISHKNTGKRKIVSDFSVSCSNNLDEQGSAWKAVVTKKAVQQTNGGFLSACGDGLSISTLERMGIQFNSANKGCRSIVVDMGNGPTSLNLTDAPTRRAVLEIMAILSNLEHLQNDIGKTAQFSHVAGLTHIELMGTEMVHSSRAIVQEMQLKAINMLIEEINRHNPSVLVHYTENEGIQHSSPRNLASTTGKYSAEDIQQFQVFLWTGVILGLVTLWIVLAMVYMENEEDPQLYSQFQRSESSHPHAE